MGLIGKAALLGVGYLLGARAGTERYDQIVAAARQAAARPELAPYLTPLVNQISREPAASTPPRPDAPVTSPTVAPPGATEAEAGTGTQPPPAPGTPTPVVAAAGELPAPPEQPPAPAATKRPRARTRRPPTNTDSAPAAPTQEAPTADPAPLTDPSAATSEIKRPRTRTRRL